MPDADTPRPADRAEQLLDRGLRNLWYPVLPSYRVNDTPIGITRLSDNIVLWRDRDGVVRALEDRCPHRGARLSLGWNLGDRVAKSMAMGDKKAEMRIVKTATGLVFEKIGQRDVNFDWVEWGETGAHWMRLTIPYRKKYGPGGPVGIVGFVTPVDETHCRVFFWRTRRAQGWQRDVWRFLYKNRLEALHREVLEQDHVVHENMAPDPRAGEFLYQHDTGMARVRRLLRKHVEAQVAALDGVR